MLDIPDTLQAVNLIIYTASLAIAIRRKLWRRHWLAVFLFIAHSVLFYAAVLLQHNLIISGWPLHDWGIALRFHLAIVVLSYLIIDRG